MKIALITGASGFVGSHLVDLLIEKGFVVRCIVRNTSNLQWLKDKKIELFDCGLNDVDALKVALQNVSYVYHIAGVVKAKNLENFIVGNVTLTKNILDACLEANSIKKIIITSSLAAAGPSKIGFPLNEKLECKPVSLYGISKYEQEKLAKGYFTKLPIIIVRPPVVFGERETDVLEFIKTVKTGIIPIAGTNAKEISIIYVGDLVEKLLKLSLTDIKSEIFYTVGIEKMRWSELGKIVAKSLDKKAIKIVVPHFIIWFLCLLGEFYAKFSSKLLPLNLNKFAEIKQEAWTCSASKFNSFFNECGNKDEIETQMQKTVNWYKENNWI